MKSRTRTTLIILIIATLAFIWGNSLGGPRKSHKGSQKATEFVRPILEPVVGKGKVTDSLVRKMAHFTEFAVLGSLLAGLVAACRRDGGGVRLQDVANCLFAGLFAALLDETIQIFTDRGALVQDVWLDFGGVCTGVALVLLAVSAFGPTGEKDTPSATTEPGKTP